jgi:hypothetical protein
MGFVFAPRIDGDLIACNRLGAARLQRGRPSLYRLGGLADFLARFAVELLRAPLQAILGLFGLQNGFQGSPQRASTVNLARRSAKPLSNMGP